MMEILIIFCIWITLLYIIRLNKELSEYRKYLRRNADIYVPSYKEIIENNHWSIQLAKFISAQIKIERTKKTSLLIPTFRKRLNEIGMVLIGKK